MMEYIALDVHKKYTWARAEDESTGEVREERIEHSRGAIRSFLSGHPSGSPVAVETVGNWYWVVDEVESAGCVPQLVNAGMAKLMMGKVNKTDKLDVKGLIRLQRSGTLPTVWIPPGEVRDARELPRTRMVLVKQKTQLKNRIHATLGKHALGLPEVKDLFGKAGRQGLKGLLPELPPNTEHVTAVMLQQLDHLERAVAALEAQITEVFKPTREMQLLLTLPGVGPVLSVVIAAEIGDIGRFGSAEHLASYSGVVPTVHGSGGKTYYGHIAKNVNIYLKWAFVEAANCIHLQGERCHLHTLYERVSTTNKRGHKIAIVAMARHLSEASYWVLTKGEPYRAPKESTRG
jgi:transposase